MSRVPLRRRALSVSPATLGKVSPGRGPWWMKTSARCRFATSSTGRMASASLRVRKALPGTCVPTMPASPSARSNSTAAAVVEESAEREGYIERLRLDPAERAEQRQHAGADALTVHPGEVEVHLVERLGQRFLAHPGLQYFDAGLVAHDARFRGPGAQGVGELGGSPVGMHIDHWRLLIRRVRMVGNLFEPREQRKRTPSARSRCVAL